MLAKFYLTRGYCLFVLHCLFHSARATVPGVQSLVFRA
jgi:hypothetical protein